MKAEHNAEISKLEENIKEAKNDGKQKVKSIDDKIESVQDERSKTLEAHSKEIQNMSDEFHSKSEKILEDQLNVKKKNFEEKRWVFFQIWKLRYVGFFK